MIRDVEAAWAHLRGLLARVPSRDAEVAAMDRDLAGFVAAHPGAFEARLLDGLGELAGAAGPREEGYATELAVLFDVPAPPARGEERAAWESAGLDATLSAADPVAMLRVHARARRDHREALGPIALHNSVRVAAFLAVRAGRDAVALAPLAPEFRDHLSALAWRSPLPDILPRDVHEMTAAEIERRVADYLGIDVEALNPWFRAGGGTGGTFLAAQDRLGEVILADARALRALGVDRHALADRLDSLLDIGKGQAFRSGRWDVLLMSFLGHQHDPFHSGDVYGLHRRGATDFQVLDDRLPPPNVIRGGDLLVPLIRRACFFEGDVPHRLDPALVARVLGLAKPDRAPG